tara:strand:+ start:1679 stop:6298 length:4620 start_codon:yes stop_codon:yes gene_type:complete
MTNYSTPGAIVGQFLPKIYTRRITLEDSLKPADQHEYSVSEKIGNDPLILGDSQPIPEDSWWYTSPDMELIRLASSGMPEAEIERELHETARLQHPHQYAELFPDRVMRSGRTSPALGLSIDFNIKDVLTDGTVGIFSQTQNQELPPESARGNIAKHMRVAPQQVSSMSGRRLSRGVIADEQNNQFKEEVLSALKIGLVLTTSPEASQQIYQFLVDSNLIAQGEKMPRPNNEGTFYERLVRKASQISHDSIDAPGMHKAIFSVMHGRPQSIGLELANSQYQTYDSQNNLVNVIPYNKTFNLSTDKFSGANLDLFCFSYFDFSSIISLDSRNDVNDRLVSQLGHFIGDITYDRITRNNKVESQSLVYRDAATGETYVGPTHNMRGGGTMSGLVHTPDSRELIRTFVPRTKVQDLRKIERSKMTYFQPPSIQLQQGGSNLQASSLLINNYLSKRNKNFFGIYDAYTQFHTTNGEASIRFQVNMIDIYRNNSRLYPLIEALDKRSNLSVRHNDGLPGIDEYPHFVLTRNRNFDRAAAEAASSELYRQYDNGRGSMTLEDFNKEQDKIWKDYTTLTNQGGTRTVDSSPYEDYIGLEDWVTRRLSLMTIQLYRRRMSSGRTDNNKLSVSRHSPYDEQNEPVHIVATWQRGRTETNDSIGSISIQDNGLGMMSFSATDKTAGGLASTNGVYQYGIKMTLRDETSDYFKEELKYSRYLLTELQDYLKIASIPIEDSFYVETNDDALPMGLAGEGAKPGSTVTYGNYNRRTGTFDSSFVQKIVDSRLESRIFAPAVDEYLNLVSLSFAQAKFSATPGSTTSIQTSEDYVDPVQAFDSLNSLEEANEYDRETARAMFLNMLKPQNGTPETIQNFITAYEQIVLSLENFFGFKDLGDGFDIEGAGFSATKGTKQIIEVERLLPENRFRKISTEYMHNPENPAAHIGDRKQLFEVFNSDTTYLSFDKQEELAGLNYTYPLDPLRITSRGVRSAGNFRVGGESENIDDYLANQFLNSVLGQLGGAAGNDAATTSRIYGSLRTRGVGGLAAPMVIVPQSLIIGTNTLEVFYSKEDMDRMYPPGDNGQRIVPYRQSSFLQQRDADGFRVITGEGGLVGEGVPIERDDPIPILAETTEQIRILDDFKRELVKVQNRHGRIASATVLEQVSNVIMEARGLTLPEQNTEAAAQFVQTAVYDIIRDYTLGLVDGTIMGQMQRYVDFSQESRLEENGFKPLIVPSRKVNVGDFNECGLYVNTEAENQLIQSDEENFEREQSLTSFYDQVRTVYDVPNTAPQPNIEGAAMQNVNDVLEEQAVRDSQILREGMMFIGITPRSGNEPTRLATNATDLQAAINRGDVLSYVPVSEISEANRLYDTTRDPNLLIDSINGFSVSSVKIPPGENNFALKVGPGINQDLQTRLTMRRADFTSAEGRRQMTPRGVVTRAFHDPGPPAREVVNEVFTESQMVPLAIAEINQNTPINFQAVSRAINPNSPRGPRAPSMSPAVMTEQMNNSPALSVQSSPRMSRFRSNPRAPVTSITRPGGGGGSGGSGY